MQDHWRATAIFVASLEQYVSGRTEKVLLQAAKPYSAIVSNFNQEDENGYQFRLSIILDTELTLDEAAKIFKDIASRRKFTLKLNSIQLEKLGNNQLQSTSSVGTFAAKLELKQISPQARGVVDTVIDELCSQNKVRADAWDEDGTRQMENLEFSFEDHSGTVYLCIRSLTSSGRGTIPAQPLTEENIWDSLKGIFYPGH